MSLIGGITAARRHLLSWFGGLALSAKAGIVTAAFFTMSAGVVIGVPYAPTSAPWTPPTVAPYATVQTPAVLKPSMVEAATPSPVATPGATHGPAQQTTPLGATSTATVQQPTSATSGGAVATSTRPAATISSAATSVSKAKTTAPTGGQTTTEVHYSNCAQASRSGAAPITSGQPGYRSGLDSDHNGVACE